MCVCRGGLELSVVISAERRKCWEFLARGTALPAPAEGARAGLTLRNFLN